MADDDHEDMRSSVMRMRDQLEKQRESSQRRIERMDARLERMMDGPPAVEKHILLLRLTELVETAPEITDSITRDQRQWLSRVGAVFSQLKDQMWRIKFNSSVGTIERSPAMAANRIIGYAYDVIEILKLELELDGRSEIGSVYEPGNVYQYFADVKEIIAGATAEIFLVDPYFNGKIFDSYFREVGSEMRVRLLVDRYASDLKGYVEKHVSTFGSQIELRRNKNDLHDRMLFVDAESCWFTGGSFKDAGKKASYLIPFDTELTHEKYAIYQAIWGNSRDLLAAAE